MKGQNFLTVTGLQHSVGYNLRREKTFSERERKSGSMRRVRERMKKREGCHGLM